MNERNTVQKKLIYNVVMSMSNHPTADMVYEKIAEEFPTISKATVYRNLNHLADKKKIMRVTVANAPDRYDKTAYTHSHCWCKNCGRVFDYELPAEIKLSGELNKDFIAEDYSLIITGYCKNCEEDV